MKKSILLVIFLTLFFIFGQSVFAESLPYEIIVNHNTKQCAEISGDECTECFPPEGWEVLGFFGEVKCPQGYTQIELTTEIICKGFKDSFCCTVGHPGGPGDCEDIVVNHVEKQCAFIEDINKCEKLPAGWEKVEQDQSLGRICPSLEYEWVSDVGCVTGGGERIVLGGSEPVIDYPVYVTVLATVVAASLVILLFLYRRKK